MPVLAKGPNVDLFRTISPSFGESSAMTPCSRSPAPKYSTLYVARISAFRRRLQGARSLPSSAFGPIVRKTIFPPDERKNSSRRCWQGITVSSRLKKYSPARGEALTAAPSPVSGRQSISCMSTRTSAAASPTTVNLGGGIGHSDTGVSLGSLPSHCWPGQSKPQPTKVPHLVGERPPPAHELDLR